MDQAPGIMTDFGHVFLLNKSLYGLKQAPHSWYENIDHFLVTLGFKCCESNHGIYVLHFHGDTLIVALYVDDLVIT